MQNDLQNTIAARWKRAAIAQPAPWAVAELHFLSQVAELVRENARYQQQNKNAQTLINDNVTSSVQDLINASHKRCEVCVRGAAVFSLIRYCTVLEKKKILTNLYLNLDYNACTNRTQQDLPTPTPVIFDYRTLSDFTQHIRERTDSTHNEQDKG